MRNNPADEKIKKAIIADLKKARIGDDEERRLFVMSLEVAFGGMTPEVPQIDSAAEPPTYDPALLELSNQSKVLSKELSSLSQDATALLLQRLSQNDSFGRSYKQAFLDSTQHVLSKIQAACEQMELHEQSSKIDPVFAQKFATVVARSFRQSFDADPEKKLAMATNILLKRMGLPEQLAEL